MNDSCSPDGTEVRDQKGQLRYRVGAVHAIQTGRGTKGVGHIQIKSIYRQDVRDISEADAVREGFGYTLGFLSTWIMMYDKEFFFWQQKDQDGTPQGWGWVTTRGDHWRHSSAKSSRGATFGSKEELMSVLRLRPKERYDAWVLEFKRV